MEESNQKDLQAVVIQNSVSQEWLAAKTEWDLLFIYNRENNCVCGHKIFENCVIRNRLNQKQLTIGNVCINHFGESKLTIEPKARSSLRKIQADPDSVKANKVLLEVALRVGILSEYEKTKYEKETAGKGSRNRYNLEHKDFSLIAYDFRSKINHLMILGFTDARPKCACQEYAKPRQNARDKSYFYSCLRWPNGCKFTKNTL